MRLSTFSQCYTQHYIHPPTVILKCRHGFKTVRLRVIHLVNPKPSVNAATTRLGNNPEEMHEYPNHFICYVWQKYTKLRPKKDGRI